MANIKLDFKESKVKMEEILEHAGVVEEINQELLDKSEDESEFLGWLKLPTEYDKKEFERIKKAAEKIRKALKNMILSFILQK